MGFDAVADIHQTFTRAGWLRLSPLVYKKTARRRLMQEYSPFEVIRSIIERVIHLWVGCSRKEQRTDGFGRLGGYSLVLADGIKMCQLLCPFRSNVLVM